MIPRSLLPILLAALAGCASMPKQLGLTPAQVLDELRKQPAIDAARYRPPIIGIQHSSESDMAAGFALGIAAGQPGTAMPSGANQQDPILRDIFAGDPSQQAQRAFLSAVEQANPPVVFTLAEDPFDAPDGEFLRRAYGGKTITDFRIMAWEIFKSSSNAALYRQSLLAKARFVRTADNAVLWEANCKCETPDYPNGPSLEDLRAGNGALARQRFAELAAECGRQLAGRFAGTATETQPGH